MPSPPDPLRTSFLFLAGLCLAGGFAIAQDTIDPTARKSVAALGQSNTAPEVQVRSPRPLDAADIGAARAAWAFFTANTRPETGLVDSVAGYPSATLWDLGSHVLALVSSHRLGIVAEADFDARALRIVAALSALPLVDGRLPNKAYDTRTLAMVDYANKPVPEGIGWSALDLARLLLALRVLEEESPRLRPALRAVLKTWDLSALTANGEIVGSSRQGSDLRGAQEGRIGYEQYAARALLLWGLDATAAASAVRVLEWKTVEGVDIGTDLRSAGTYGAIDPVLSEPYILMGLELGLNSEAAILAARIYGAQKNRFDSSGVKTMVSEDHLDRTPYFLYSAVYGNGAAWTVVDDGGASWPELRTISTKAVFGWDALYGTDYTAMLRRDLAGTLVDPTAGWAAGRYEHDGSPNSARTLNTNAVILEAMHFKAFGPLLQR